MRKIIYTTVEVRLTMGELKCWGNMPKLLNPSEDKELQAKKAELKGALGGLGSLLGGLGDILDDLESQTPWEKFLECPSDRVVKLVVCEVRELAMTRVGIALCSVDDTFNARLGKKLACKRAFNAPFYVVSGDDSEKGMSKFMEMLKTQSYSRLKKQIEESSNYYVKAEAALEEAKAAKAKAKEEANQKAEETTEKVSVEDTPDTQEGTEIKE